MQVTNKAVEGANKKFLGSYDPEVFPRPSLAVEAIGKDAGVF